jgi:uncharacterized protein (DUF697 family)
MAETTATATQHHAAANPTLTPAERAARLARAETLVKDHILMSGAVGLIPAPGLDILAGMGIQVALLKRLSDLYKTPFSENAARGIVTSLLGGLGTGALAGGIFFSAIKILPGAGTLIGVAALPISLAAMTYAVGKLFVAHFEIGGTLDSFNVAANRRYFSDLVKRGREVAGTLTTSASRRAATTTPATAKDPARA